MVVECTWEIRDSGSLSSSLSEKTAFFRHSLCIFFLQQDSASHSAFTLSFAGSEIETLNACLRVSEAA